MMHVCGGERGRRRRAECQRSPARGVGEGRLLGDDDWSPAGRALDAIRGSASGLAARPLLAIEAYGLARFAHDNPAASLGGTVRGQTVTGALAAHGDARGWKWGVEGAYQGGRVDALGAIRRAFARGRARLSQARRRAVATELRAGGVVRERRSRDGGVQWVRPLDATGSRPGLLVSRPGRQRAHDPRGRRNRRNVGRSQVGSRRVDASFRVCIRLGRPSVTTLESA